MITEMKSIIDAITPETDWRAGLDSDLFSVYMKFASKSADTTVIPPSEVAKPALFIIPSKLTNTSEIKNNTEDEKRGNCDTSAELNRQKFIGTMGHVFKTTPSSKTDAPVVASSSKTDAPVVASSSKTDAPVVTSSPETDPPVVASSKTDASVVTSSPETDPPVVASSSKTDPPVVASSIVDTKLSSLDEPESSWEEEEKVRKELIVTLENSVREGLLANGEKKFEDMSALLEKIQLEREMDIAIDRENAGAEKQSHFFINNNKEVLDAYTGAQEAAAAEVVYRLLLEKIAFRLQTSKEDVTEPPTSDIKQLIRDIHEGTLDTSLTEHEKTFLKELKNICITLESIQQSFVHNIQVEAIRNYRGSSVFGFFFRRAVLHQEINKNTEISSRVFPPNDLPGHAASKAAAALLGRILDWKVGNPPAYRIPRLVPNVTNVRRITSGLSGETDFKTLTDLARLQKQQMFQGAGPELTNAEKFQSFRVMLKSLDLAPALTDDIAQRLDSPEKGMTASRAVDEARLVILQKIGTYFVDDNSKRAGTTANIKQDVKELEGIGFLEPLAKAYDAPEHLLLNAINSINKEYEGQITKKLDKYRKNIYEQLQNISDMVINHTSIDDISTSKIHEGGKAVNEYHKYLFSTVIPEKILPSMNHEQTEITAKLNTVFDKLFIDETDDARRQGSGTRAIIQAASIALIKRSLASTLAQTIGALTISLIVAMFIEPAIEGKNNNNNNSSGPSH
jgi:hypothetical protein